jgi:16S rRNA (guanine527-N7)-methyltransferase
MQVGSKKWRNFILNGARELGVQMDQGKIDQFEIHALELLKWTRKTNLTAISEPLEMAVKLFLDSIAPAPMIPPNASLLDMGSGGGFPGIPLKIMIPSLSVMLIDASRKKVSFLKHVIRMLHLHNIEAIHVRAEDLSKDIVLMNTYDVIISRALSSLVNFVQMSLPLLSKDGLIIAMKGKMSVERIESALSLVKGSPDAGENNISNVNIMLKKYRLPYLKSERSIVVLKKTH